MRTFGIMHMYWGSYAWTKLGMMQRYGEMRGFIIHIENLRGCL